MLGHTIHGHLPWRSEPEVIWTPWHELAAAIIALAAKDYVQNLQLKERAEESSDENLIDALSAERSEIERFFYSRLFGQISDMDPDVLITRCKKAAARKMQEAKEKKEKPAKRAVRREKRNETGKTIN